MKFFLKIFYALTMILIVYITNLLIVNFLPFPLSSINCVLIFLIWLIIYKNNLDSLWIGVVLGALNELYSVTPFGIILIATTLSLVLVSWFLFNIFTNRSLYIVFFSALVGLSGYKIIYLLVMLASNLVTGQIWHYQLPRLAESLWTISLSSLALVIIYWLTSFFAARLKPEFLHSKSSRYEFR